ncbi:MAG: hypothetical protein ACTSPK_00060 [Candidatus Heimdallarchaeota archaeon]
MSKEKTNWVNCIGCPYLLKGLKSNYCGHNHEDGTKTEHKIDFLYCPLVKMEENYVEIVRAKIENEYFPIGKDKVIMITMWKSLGRVMIGNPDDPHRDEFMWDYDNPPKLFLGVIETILKKEMKREDLG